MLVVFLSPFFKGIEEGFMDRIDRILFIVGRIEGRFENVEKLPERVAKLERWQAWLKGAWTALALGFLYLCRVTVSK